ncbi:unnamed protein product, partial [Closterium sp. NIES-53]
LLRKFVPATTDIARQQAAPTARPVPEPTLDPSKILAHRVRLDTAGRHVDFLIRWTDRTSEDDTWVPSASLDASPTVEKSQGFSREKAQTLPTMAAAASAAAESDGSLSNEESFTEPEEGWVGRLTVPVAMVGDPCEEVMLLWGLRDPFTARMGCFVDQGATSVRIEACGQVLDIFQSPSCLVRPGVTGSVLWDSGVVLAKALEHLADSARLPIRGARCLELGAGCGLVGIVAALLGASHVHITDQYDRLRLLHRNVCHNLLPSHPLSAPSSSLNSSSVSSSSSSSFSHGSGSSARHASGKKASVSSASGAGSASGGGGGGSGGGGKRRGGAGKAGAAAAGTAGQIASVGDGGMGGGGGGESGAWPEVVEICHGRKGGETRVRVRVFELEWGEDMVLPGFDGEEDEEDENENDTDGSCEDEEDDEEEDEEDDAGEEEGGGGRGREWGEQERRGARRGYDYVVASDVVFSEEGLEVLMQALGQLVRPHTTVLIAGELRNDEVLQLFLERAQARFTVGRLQDRHQHPDFISRRVVVYCLARKRRRQVTGSDGR